MNRFIALISAAALVVSCGEISIEKETADDISGVVASASDFTFDEVATRTTITQSGSSAPSFAWKSGDVIGVIPMDNETVQSNYRIKQIGSNPKLASFDGGVWALKQGKEYAAYYPFKKTAAVSGDSVSFSFEGQKQTANNSLAHLGDYDYMYANTVSPVDGSALFEFRHLVSLIRLQITLPGGTYSGIMLEADEEWFATDATLSLSSGSLRAGGLSSAATLDLADIYVPEGTTLTVWLSVLPTSVLKGKTIYVYAYETNEGYEVGGSVNDLAAFSAGSAYSYSVSLDALEKTEEYESVDLGLSVKWASCNLGASSPEDYGNYFAWGETSPKALYNWSTYTLCNGSNTSLIKYNSDSSKGVVDNKTSLDAEDDAAHVIMKDNWRMPTYAEFDELMDNCNMTLTYLNGVYGCRVQSKKPGYTDKWIFLPATGFFTQTVVNSGTFGSYASSTLDSSNTGALGFSFTSLAGGSRGPGHFSREMGVSIRPVYGASKPSYTLSLGKTSLSLEAGETYTMPVETDYPGSLDWRSSDESIFKVNASGVITAVGKGVATLTVSTTDGLLSAKCTVTVTEDVPSVRVSFTNLDTSSGSVSFGQYVVLTSGVKLGVAVTNSSNAAISITGFKLSCSMYNVTRVFNLTDTLESGYRLTLTVPITTTFYSPVATVTYTYKGKEYQASNTFTGSISSW